MKIFFNILITLFLLLRISSGWTIKECSGSPAYDNYISWTNCIGTYTWANGDKYEGEWRDDVMHGKGTYSFSTGDKYEGEWKDDKFHGEGTYYFLADNEYKGNKYVGEFKDNDFYGKGTYYFLADNEFKGDKYVGEFKDDLKNGKGTYFFADGEVWDGQWKDEEWVRGKKYAKGEYTGSKVASNICPGSPLKTNYSEIPSSWNNCEGVYIYTDKGFEGNKYEGSWKNGKKHGLGTYYFLANNEFRGSKYVGEWKDDKFHGEGIYTDANGEIYKGEFFNHTRKGQGTIVFKNRDKYEGEWKDDKFHGEGTYYFLADNEYKGDKYVGEFKANDFYGKGTFYFLADNEFKGDKYVGEFKDDLKNGKGTYFFADGRVWEGQWENDNWVSGKKYAKGEYNGSVIADNNNRQNEQTLEDLERERRKSSEERRKREQAERELAELKAQKKKEKERISSDIDPPQIVINSTNVLDKQGTIKGKVSDNYEVAELTIDGRRVSISNSGSFTHNLFVPQDGIKVSIEATDNSGLTTKEIIALERNETEQTKVFNFAKLNPLNIKGKKNKNSIALIIGISKYNNAPEAKYADRDANYFSDFAESVLGINSQNIKLISNNSANGVELKKALKIWLKGYSTQKKSDIYIFFAGHGLASNDGKELYLLPYDGEPRLLEDTALLRSEIFDTVKSINPKSVTVFLDACYSGQTREEDMILADARPIAIVPIESDVPENFTVFSASSGSEISGSLPEADHGLFSYFLMKGLEGDADANNDKKITNGELHTYVRSNVTRQAVRLGREQTPQLQGDENRVLVEFN